MAIAFPLPNTAFQWSSVFSSLPFRGQGDQEGISNPKIDALASAILTPEQAKLDLLKCPEARAIWENADKNSPFVTPSKIKTFRNLNEIRPINVWKPDSSPDCQLYGKRRCSEHCEDIQARGIKIYEYEIGNAKTIIFSKSDCLIYKLNTETASQVLQRNGYIKKNRLGSCYSASAFLHRYVPGSNVIGFWGPIEGDPPSFYPNLGGDHHQFRFMNPEKEEYLILDPTIPPTYQGHNSVLIVESSKADLDDTYHCVFGTSYQKFTPYDATVDYLTIANLYDILGIQRLLTQWTCPVPRTRYCSYSSEPGIKHCSYEPDRCGLEQFEGE